MWETFTPEDQGFLINVNRIRVSRDLRTTRKGAPKGIRLIFLNFPYWRWSDERVTHARYPRNDTLKSVAIETIGKSVVFGELESMRKSSDFFEHGNQISEKNF